MKEKNPTQGSRNAGRKPQAPAGGMSKNYGRPANAGSKASGGKREAFAPGKGKPAWAKDTPAFGDRRPAQGKSGIGAPRVQGERPQGKWGKDGAGDTERGPARGFGPFRKDGGKRFEPGSEKRYGRPGSRDTYQPRQAQGKAEEGFQSPAARRFGPGSRQTFTPTWSRDARPQANKPEASLDTPEITAVEAASLEGVNLLTGRNPIREALKTGRDLEKLMVVKGDISGSARQIVSMAKDAGVMVQFVERKRLDQVAKNHQGMVAYASAYQYASLEDILETAKAKNEPPFIIILDQLTDPHNLGAIIRTAACAGAHGVVVPMHRAVGLTPAAVKASAGAVEHIKVARVTNLNQTIEKLKERGIWVYAADQSGEDYRGVNITGPCVLVIGSEGEGISALTLTLCDHRLKIPMADAIGSLNASVAAGVLMYAVFGGRNPFDR